MQTRDQSLFDLVVKFRDMKEFDEVATFHFDKYLVLGLSEEWLKVFKEPPRFTASLDNDGKLHLISTKSVYKKS